MTPEEKERIKNELTREISSLKQELDELRSKDTPFISDRSHGRMGWSDAIKNKSIHDRWIQSLEEKLNGLQKNLLNIDTAQFGICDVCAKPIGEERLKAIPETKKCVKCAELY